MSAADAGRFAPRFDDRGLVTAVVVSGGEVLMVAHMNKAAYDATLATGLAHFWSRSRATLWLKGETSGNRLRLRSVRADCDGDALLLDVTVEGAGVACHTGTRSCFSRLLDAGGRVAAGDQLAAM